MLNKRHNLSALHTEQIAGRCDSVNQTVVPRTQLLDCQGRNPMIRYFSQIQMFVKHRNPFYTTDIDDTV